MGIRGVPVRRRRDSQLLEGSFCSFRYGRRVPRNRSFREVSQEGVDAAFSSGAFAQAYGQDSSRNGFRMPALSPGSLPVLIDGHLVVDEASDLPWMTSSTQPPRRSTSFRAFLYGERTSRPCSFLTQIAFPIRPRRDARMFDFAFTSRHRPSLSKDRRSRSIGPARVSRSSRNDEVDPAVLRLR